MFSSLHQVLFWLGHLINVKRPVGLRLEFWLKCSSICFSILVPLWCRSCMEQTPPRIPSTSSRSVNYISFFIIIFLKILDAHFFNGIVGVCDGNLDLYEIAAAAICWWLRGIHCVFHVLRQNITFNWHIRVDVPISVHFLWGKHWLK